MAGCCCRRSTCSRSYGSESRVDDIDSRTDQLTCARTGRPGRSFQATVPSSQMVLACGVSASFAAAMMRAMFSFDMKSGNGMAPVIADRNAFVASWL
jgi:hypothetical protein